MTLRLLLLGPLPPPYSGPEVMTRALVDGLAARREFTIHHLNTQVSRSLAEKGGQHQLRKALKGLRQALRLVRLLISFRPDIVYLPLTNSPSFLGFLRDSLFMVPALLAGRAVMIRLHGGFYYYAHLTGWRGRLVRAILGQVQLAMVQGERLRTVFGDMVDPARIRVVPNGLADQEFQAARQRTAGQPRPPRKRVLFVGILCAEKGFRDLIAAIPTVPDAEFAFAGEWPSAAEEAEVRAFLAQAGVLDRVHFAGVVSGAAKYDLFCSADIFAFPSYYVYEGHAVSSVEALAAGLPIVCTNHGALSESVRDGWNGFFVPPRDPAALADRLNQLLGDATLRQTMGARSRTLYERHFTLSQFLENWSAAVLDRTRPALALEAVP